MKESITTDQWEELSDVGEKNVWRNWSYKNKYVQVDDDGAVMPMPTVFQMIHFLERNRVMFITSVIDDENKHSWIVNGIEKKELCDALWEHVKKVIKNDKTH